MVAVLDKCFMSLGAFILLNKQTFNSIGIFSTL
jgi:hypothetical protein